jgi:hypothetical protein
MTPRAFLPVDIDSVESLDHSEFHDLWLQYFGKSLQIPARKELHVRCLAYRIQEKAQGGLGAVTRKRLRKLAAELELNPCSGVIGSPRIKPGTRLIREWQGETYKVTVTAEGFSYDGERFKSLSEIARLITGTHWSGPRFFGLEAGRSKREVRKHVR